MDRPPLNSGKPSSFSSKMRRWLLPGETKNDATITTDNPATNNSINQFTDKRVEEVFIGASIWQLESRLTGLPKSEGSSSSFFSKKFFSEIVLLDKYPSSGNVLHTSSDVALPRTGDQKKERRFKKKEAKKEVLRSTYTLLEAEDLYNGLSSAYSEDTEREIGGVKLKDFFDAYQKVSGGKEKAEHHAKTYLRGGTFKGMKETTHKDLREARKKLSNLTKKLNTQFGHVEVVDPNGETHTGNVSVDSARIVDPKRKLEDIERDLTGIKDKCADRIRNFVDEITSMKIDSTSLGDLPEDKKKELARAWGVKVKDFNHIAQFPSYVSQTDKLLSPEGHTGTVDDKTRRTTYRAFLRTFEILRRLQARAFYENPEEAAQGFEQSPKKLDNEYVQGWLTAMANDFDGLRKRTVKELRKTLDSYYSKDKIKSDRTTQVSDDWKVPRVGEKGEIGIRVYTPKEGTGPFPALMYFHGGGWIVGTLDSVDNTCDTLAREAGCVVVSVDYRLAPENKWPAAPKDCFTATVWVYQNAKKLNVDHKRMAVGGTSAGGNLAAVVALMCRDKPDSSPRLSLQLLAYPATDLRWKDNSTPSIREYGVGYSLDTEDLIEYAGHYLEEGQSTHPYASPALAPKLNGLPETVITTAECDTLRYEAENLGKRLRMWNIPTTITRYNDTIHAFFNTGLPGGKHIKDQWVATLKRVLKTEGANVSSEQRESVTKEKTEIEIEEIS